jgi:hypothetical protein
MRSAALCACTTLAVLLGTLGCARTPAAPDEVEQITHPIALDRMTRGMRYHSQSGSLVENGLPVVTTVDGRIVIVAISMSNGFMEMNRFIELYAQHPEVHPRMALVNCARGGHALERWLSMPSLWEDCRERIVAAGFSPEQVRVVWAKNANQDTQHGRTLPDPNADYHDLVRNIAALSQRIAQELPSVQAVFHSSRIYGRYANAAARGEPLSYEGGFAVNEVIRRQKRGELTGAPWVGWGPYLWADGVEPNASGLIWLRADFQADGVHPSATGQAKVAHALHRHFRQFDWYRR